MLRTALGIIIALIGFWVLSPAPYYTFGEEIAHFMRTRQAFAPTIIVVGFLMAAAMTVGGAMLAFEPRRTSAK